MMIPPRRPRTVALLIGMAFVCTITGCTAPLPPRVTQRLPVHRVFEEDDIREAVFRYLFNSHQLRGPIFLSIDGYDPSPSFLARFAGMEFQPKPISRSYFKLLPFPGWLRDRTTSKKGMAYSVDSISWTSPTRAEVRGGSYCGGLCAASGVFTVVKMHESWIVESYRVEAVA